MRLNHLLHLLALKTTLLAWVVSLALLPLSGATYSDEEKSGNNQFTSGAIDLTLTSPTTNFDPALLGLGDTATRRAVFGGNNSNPMIYSQEFELVSGDPELCAGVQLKAYWQWYNTSGVLQKTVKYSGPLADFKLNLAGTDPNLLLPDQTPYYPNSDYAAGQQWYFYELKLPTTVSSQLGNKTCEFDIVAKAWPLRHNLGPDVGFWDEERLHNTISSEVLALASGVKFEDLDGDGNRETGEAGIANWKIYAAEEVQTLNVPADGTPATSQVLENGVHYLVRARGTFFAGDNITADAKYANKPPSGDWTDTVPGYEAYGPTLLNLWVNGSSPDWGPYHSDHDYWLELTGEGTALNFYIFDIYYPNNLGNLTVTLYQVKSETITDSEGHYELDLSPFSHEVVIAEEQKDGWKQTKPDRKYYPVSVPGIWENRDFGNQRYTEPPQPVKIVINEVYYDVIDGKGEDGGGSQSDEWVELYNPSDQTVNLKDWSLTDNVSTRTISHRDVWLPAHSYAVLAKAAQTWTYWSIPGTAIKIELGDSIGNGLANDGDHLFLKNNKGEEVDYVSWGDEGISPPKPRIWNPAVPDVAEGHSISRNPAGFDTDAPSDWMDTHSGSTPAGPNPGTNPHSEIQVAVNQVSQNELVIGIINAKNIDAVKYSVKYSHKYAGVEIPEGIEGESIKFAEQNIFLLPLMYLGTCSPIEGKVCTPHQNIGLLTIDLMFKSGPNVVETTSLQYTWQN